MLTDRNVLKDVILPDPDDDALYEPARAFVKRHKGEYALYCAIRMGVSFILNSMDILNFSYQIEDDPDFVRELLSIYTDWVSRLIDNLQECGFDFFWTFDDLAYKEGTMFSLEVWDSIFSIPIKKVADHIKIPWVFHSDGNIMPLLDRLAALGMSGIHPLEPGAMDLGALKKNYGEKLCLIGNVDIDHTLTNASKDEVFACVKEKMDLLGAGGGFIISDSNSIPDYCNPQNIEYMAQAVEMYRHIY